MNAFLLRQIEKTEFMYNHDVSIELLMQIDDALTSINTRFQTINSVNDFLIDEPGLEKLDGICMKLIAVGENLKKIDKHTDFTLLKKYPQIDWKGVKGIRDVISHHYFDVDAEEIFVVCNRFISPLHEVIKTMIFDLKNGEENA